MTRIHKLEASTKALAIRLSALAAFLAAVATTTVAQVLMQAVPGDQLHTGRGNEGNNFQDLITTADNLTDKAIIPVIGIAPLAAIAGAFALLIGGGGQHGSTGVKLIAGAIGAVVVVMFAKGLAA